MIDLYTWNTPNGQKASIMLEEIGLPYQIFPVNISQGEQHTDAFLAINPNGKIPAIVDQDVAGGQRVFESGAILVYLAEKSGQLLPTNGSNRAEVLSCRAVLNVLNHHLNDRTFIADDYSIADITNYTWTSSGLNLIRSAHSERVENLTAIDRWVKILSARPAVKKSLEVLKSL